MPRYYFHLDECGSVTSDEEGRDLSDANAARVAATAEARMIMSAEVREGELCLACCIVINDDTGVEIDRVNFRDALKVRGISAGC